MIGDFEYRVLAAVSQLGEGAYGASLRRLLGEYGSTPTVGALYTTLDRLQTKGLIETWMGESTPERGGRAKRMVRLTPEGARQARAFYESIMHASRNVVWAGIHD